MSKDLLPFEYARADRPAQLELPGMERTRRPQLSRITRLRVDLGGRSRAGRARRQKTPGPRGQLYWMRENAPDSER